MTISIKRVDQESILKSLLREDYQQHQAILLAERQCHSIHQYMIHDFDVDTSACTSKEAAQLTQGHILTHQTWTAFNRLKRRWESHP